MPHDIPHDEFTEHYVEVPTDDDGPQRYLHVRRVCRACGAVKVNIVGAPRGGPAAGGITRWYWPGEKECREVMPVCVGVTG